MRLTSRFTALIAIALIGLATAACFRTPPEVRSFVSHERPCGVDSVVDADTAIATAPRPAGPPPSVPRYPDRMRNAGVEGRAVLAFVIDTSGRVISASTRVVQETYTDFGDSACKSIVTFRFPPFVVNGRPMTVHVTQYSFEWNDIGVFRRR